MSLHNLANLSKENQKNFKKHNAYLWIKKIFFTKQQKFAD